jgi:hypothetical protein
MDHQEILARLAPCGVGCGRCIAYGKGEIKRWAGSIREALTGFEKMVTAWADNIPALAQYAGFRAVLDLLADASCAGCRVERSKSPICEARTCCREKGVEFCFQCDEFPCDRNQYPDHLRQRWLSNNQRMKEIGVEQFFQEQAKKPRY